MTDLQQGTRLKAYNTFGLDVSCRFFTAVHSVAELADVVSLQLFKTEPHLFLGGGSNILFTKNFDGIIIKIDIKGIEVVSENEDVVDLRVGAGENWHQFVLHCIDLGYGGIENLSLIPGTVGAAPMQNIGAYGVEVKDVITHVEVFDLNNRLPKIFSAADCKFGYRESIFKHEAKDQYVITHVTFRLTKRNHTFHTEYGAIREMLRQSTSDNLSIRAISDAVIAIRSSKLPDPKNIGNAGSFFKNPTISLEKYERLRHQHPTIPGYSIDENEVKVPAGWLIEQRGWKGKTVGDIGVHKQQALVLVNYGNGNGNAIWDLALAIQKDIADAFDIHLQPEVNVV